MGKSETGWGKLYREDLWQITGAGLSSGCIAVYAALCAFGDNCYPSIKELQKHCGARDDDTVRRNLKKLADLGFITIYPRYSESGQTSNEYHIIHDGRKTPTAEITEGENTDSEKYPLRKKSKPTPKNQVAPTPRNAETKRPLEKNKEKKNKENTKRKPIRTRRKIEVKPEFLAMKGNTTLSMYDAQAVKILADYSTQELADCTELIRGYLNTGKRRAGGRANAQLTAGAPVILKLLEAGYTEDDFRECRSRLESGVWQWSDVPQIVREVCG